MGRFNPFHEEIRDNCAIIDRKRNDFRTFLCDRLLRHVRDATDELRSPRDLVDFNAGPYAHLTLPTI